MPLPSVLIAAGLAWGSAFCETFLKLLLFEFCSPRLTPSPAEIEEELRGLQDVPSHLRQYMEAEPAGKEGKRAVGGQKVE